MRLTHPNGGLTAEPAPRPATDLNPQPDLDNPKPQHPFRPPQTDPVQRNGRRSRSDGEGNLPDDADDGDFVRWSDADGDWVAAELTTKTWTGLSLSCPVGEERLFSVDFAIEGAFAVLYAARITITAGPTAGKCALSLIVGPNQTDKIWALCRNAPDSGDATVTFTLVVQGFDWTAAGGGTPTAAAAELRAPGGVNTPAQITANQNDYALGTAEVQRLSTDASRNVTGFVAQLGGVRKTIINVGSADLVITNEDVLSAAANRTITGTGASVVLGADDTAELVYDPVSTRWRML